MSYILGFENRTLSPKSFLKETSIKFIMQDDVTTCIIECVHQECMLLSFCGIKVPCKKKFVGISKCGEQDEYNEMIGKDIAEHRARRDMYFYLEKLFYELESYLSQAACKALDMADWALGKANRQRRAIEELKTN